MRSATSKPCLEVVYFRYLESERIGHICFFGCAAFSDSHNYNVFNTIISVGEK